MALVEDRGRALVQATRGGVTTVATGVAAMWAVHLVNTFLFFGQLSAFGIHPRSMEGLLGILFAPLLHGSFAHLALNSVSFVVLGLLTMLRRRVDFAVVTVGGTISSGLGVWLIGGANTVHIGASGVIFAYLGFLMARGWFERRPGAVVLSFLVTWFFGGMVWGVLPTVGAAISWEAHLFGFLGGVAIARLLGTGIRKKGRS
jgi:membrane associated rhomboid family serine protease